MGWGVVEMREGTGVRQKKARAQEERDRCGAHWAGQAGRGTPIPTVRAAVHPPPRFTLRWCGQVLTGEEGCGRGASEGAG